MPVTLLKDMALQHIANGDSELPLPTFSLSVSPEGELSLHADAPGRLGFVSTAFIQRPGAPHQFKLSLFYAIFQQSLEKDLSLPAWLMQSTGQTPSVSGNATIARLTSSLTFRIILRVCLEEGCLEYVSGIVTYNPPAQ